MNTYKDNLTQQIVTVRENKDNQDNTVYLVKYPASFGRYVALQLAPSLEVSTTEINFKENKFTERFTKVN